MRMVAGGQVGAQDQARHDEPCSSWRTGSSLRTRPGTSGGDHAPPDRRKHQDDGGQPEVGRGQSEDGEASAPRSRRWCPAAPLSRCRSALRSAPPRSTATKPKLERWPAAGSPMQLPRPVSRPQQRGGPGSPRSRIARRSSARTARSTGTSSPSRRSSAARSMPVPPPCAASARILNITPRSTASPGMKRTDRNTRIGQRGRRSG